MHFAVEQECLFSHPIFVIQQQCVTGGSHSSMDTVNNGQHHDTYVHTTFHSYTIRLNSQFYLLQVSDYCFKVHS